MLAVTLTYAFAVISCPIQTTLCHLAIRCPSSAQMCNQKTLLMSIQGAGIADIIPTFGMINMIGGECDR